MRYRRDARLPGLALSAALAIAGCDRGSPEPDKPAEAATPLGPSTLGPRVSALAPRGESWNAAQIEWHGWDDGLALAKAQKKPILLVFWAVWCGHCRNYSHVFDDPTVVERAKDFVMIRANVDEESELNRRFTIDGGYVPRTYFLSPDGTLAREIHAARPNFQYFYDERNPASLLAGMAAARKLAMN